MRPGPPRPHVGGMVLLSEGATAGPNGRFVREPPFLLDGSGRAAQRGPWLNRPLKVIQETTTAYVLDDGTGQYWAYLPKRNLEKKAVFPLVSDNAMTQRIAAELVGKRVWVNGRPVFPCEIVNGYHAAVMLESARVLSVWQLDAPGVNVSPQGGLVDGGSLRNERVGTTTTLVMLGEPEKLRANSASMEPKLAGQSAQLLSQAPQRCTTLPAVYATYEDVRRNLTVQRPPKLNVPPQSAAWVEKFLIRKTRAQILATYGSPNEEGSLAAVMSLPVWNYGDVPYASMAFAFDDAGRVGKASIATSP